MTSVKWVEHTLIRSDTKYVDYGLVHIQTAHHQSPHKKYPSLQYFLLQLKRKLSFTECEYLFQNIPSLFMPAMALKGKIFSK